MGLTRCGAVFLVAVVVGEAVPAMCRWVAVPALSWSREVSLGVKHVIIIRTSHSQTPGGFRHLGAFITYIYT